MNRARVLESGDEDEVLFEIRRMLRKNKVRVNDAAKHINCSKSHMSHKLHGRTRVYIAEFLALCELAGIEVILRER